MQLPLGPELLAGADTVLLQLPKTLAELEEIAAAVAGHAAPDVRLRATVQYEMIESRSGTSRCMCVFQMPKRVNQFMAVV